MRCTTFDYTLLGLSIYEAAVQEIVVSVSCLEEQCVVLSLNLGIPLTVLGSGASFLCALGCFLSPERCCRFIALYGWEQCKVIIWHFLFLFLLLKVV